MKIILKGRIPSKKNSTRRIKRGNRIFNVPSEAHEQWHVEQQYSLMKQRLIPDDPIEKCHYIDLYFHFPDKRRADLSNKTESVMDLLVDVGILKDDSWQVTGPMYLHPSGVDKNDPRVEIFICY